LQNDASGNVGFAVTSSATLVLFASAQDLLAQGATFTATAVFTNGARYIGTFTLTQLPSHEVAGPLVSVENLVSPATPGDDPKEAVGSTFSVENVVLPDPLAVGPKETVGLTFSV